MTIVFDYNLFNAIIYTKKYCVTKRESAKKHKQDIKCELALNIKNMAIVLDSNHFNTMIYAKY